MRKGSNLLTTQLIANGICLALGMYPTNDTMRRLFRYFRCIRHVSPALKTCKACRGQTRPGSTWGDITCFRNWAGRGSLQCDVWLQCRVCLHAPGCCFFVDTLNGISRNVAYFLMRLIVTYCLMKKQIALPSI